MKTSVLFCVFLLTAPSLLAQSPRVAQDAGPVHVTIRRGSNAVDDAVRIVGFRLDGKFYDLGVDRASPSINTTSGWLERLEIVVKNISPKTMVAGAVQVNCPSINYGPPEQMIVDQLTVGKVPERFPMAAARKNVPISLEPSQQVTFVLGKDFDRLRKQLPQSGPFPDCIVYPPLSFFSDGTMWRPRHFFKPDPNSDHGYIETKPEEFGIDVPAQYK